MVTGNHGVRLQADYVQDEPGGTGGAPRWLRLTRAGDTVTGAESGDGIRWATIGAVHLPGLPAAAEVGLFVTSPQYFEEVHDGVNSGSAGGPSQATGSFDHLALQGGWTGAAWRTDRIGGPDNEPRASDAGVRREGDTFRLSGSGDIAPAVPGAAGAGLSVTQTLVGTFAGLIILVAIGAAFVTAEYRRGLIRTTLAATPTRMRVLAAKAAVLAAVTFVAGLVAAAVVVVLGQRVLRAQGVYVHPTSMGTQLRIVVGTGALLAVAAILALALGTLIRGSVAAITAGVVVIVLPYVLAVTVLPDRVAEWMLRISPAAAFAVQQSATVYPQVANIYTPAAGYFPLPGWAGFAVLAGVDGPRLRRCPRGAGPAGRMRHPLHAEWTKLRTSPGTLPLILTLVAGTVGISALSVTCSGSGCDPDLPRLSLTGVQLGQAVVAILAVLTMGTEYSTGMIGVTLAAVPRRGTVLTAKALVLAAIVAVASAVAVAGCLVVGGALLPGYAAVLRPAVGSVMYLALIGLLSLGVVTALRSPAAAIGVVLALLYALPIVIQAVQDAGWRRHLLQATPTSAGLAVQATGNDAPIDPWLGLGVLALWTVAALLAGGLLLVRRDA